METPLALFYGGADTLPDFDVRVTKSTGNSLNTLILTIALAL